MAALPEWSETRVVDLRRLSADDISPLLDEEAANWLRVLDWDQRPSADLVRRFVRMQSLNGFGLVERGRVIGYAYYLSEESKGLIGGLYVAERVRTPEREDALIEASLDAMWRTPGVRRVEAQLMLLENATTRPMPYPALFHRFPRWFMELAAAGPLPLPARPQTDVEILPWLDSYREDAARLVAAAYQGHVDSDINDQYRSVAGARRFLTNIIEYPGCGAFLGAASYAAADKRTGAICGISLGSLVSVISGHITQICVAPSRRGTGLGYELLRRSLLALAAQGCSTVSLTVTAQNSGAIELYERMGFRKRRNFAAYVWEWKPFQP
jgi:ribosomal protein S18 acetylase RimI-like enzyme